MTVHPTGAASHDIVKGWHDIDWKAVYHNVRRLQARIVKATKEGKWGKVKALQRLLTHSYSGKALAIRRVTENNGAATPGVDTVIWNTPQKKVVNKVNVGSYTFSVKRAWINAICVWRFLTNDASTLLEALG